MIKTLPAFFRTQLTASIDAGTVLMPIPTADAQLIKDYLQPDGYTFLNLRGPAAAEVVRVEFVEGQLAWERGFDNTKPSAFPKGACLEVGFNTELVKSLVCEFDCCDGPCPCVPVELAGVAVEDATVGQDWQATAVFKGDTPMAITCSAVPGWCSITIGANYMTLSGKPTVAAEYSVAVSATNCAGKLANGIIQFRVV